MNRTEDNLISIPGATYRLQFSREFPLNQALGILDYLAELGITTAYASPLFQAGPESTHGYDVCSFGTINSNIGTAEEFDRFSTELKRRGMTLLLDMVPNHMGAALSNSWWLDVLEHGRESKYGRFFDINWDSHIPSLRNKVLIPVLEDHYAKVLENGKLRLEFENDRFSISYYDRKFPVAPESLPPDKHQQPSETLKRFNGEAGKPESFNNLHDLIQKQHYRLACWRIASELINYRRFFDVTELVSLRMELPEVFKAAHELAFDWIKSGKLHGLRIDHPDGLRDPKQYFERLQQRTANLAGFDLHKTLPQSKQNKTCATPEQCLQPAQPLYVVVEKILSGDEELPSDWPVAGTTGYDFLNRVNGLFVNEQSATKLDRIYQEFARADNSAPHDFEKLVRGSKRKILETSLISELDSLTHRLSEIARATRDGIDFTFNQLRSALKEFIVAFPIYRTYLTDDSLQPTAEERAVITKAVADARVHGHIDESLIQFLEQLLTLKLLPKLDTETVTPAREFIARFQQLTGPVMAKGLEDTTFYNFNRLISLNEVGGDPARCGISVEAFHNANASTQARWPHTLLATATHDTKRGEDARARINVLSELSDEWESAVNRWTDWNARRKVLVDGKPAPSRNDEYQLYQSLVGALPRNSGAADELKSFRERTVNFMLKAIREAKANTTWTSPNTAYENAAQQFTEQLLSDATDNSFFADLCEFSRRVAFFGRFNSLSQTLLKLTSPGVPDFYQGTELWDFSYVDPDNRRPVDFGLRKKLFAELRAQPASALPDPAADDVGVSKLFVIWRAIELRKHLRLVFDHGAYVPLPAFGMQKEHLCAFARTHDRFGCIVVTPRLVAELTRGREVSPIGEALWADTILPLPETLADRQFRNVFTQETIRSQERNGIRSLQVGEVLKRFPVALLEAID